MTQGISIKFAGVGVIKNSNNKQALVVPRNESQHVVTTLGRAITRWCGRDVPYTGVHGDDEPQGRTWNHRQHTGTADGTRPLLTPQRPDAADADWLLMLLMLKTIGTDDDLHHVTTRSQVGMSLNLLNYCSLSRFKRESRSHPLDGCGMLEASADSMRLGLSIMVVVAMVRAQR